MIFKETYVSFLKQNLKRLENLPTSCIRHLPYTCTAEQEISKYY